MKNYKEITHARIQKVLCRRGSYFDFFYYYFKRIERIQTNTTISGVSLACR